MYKSYFFLSKVAIQGAKIIILEKETRSGADHKITPPPKSI